MFSLVSFIFPRELESFNPRHLMRSPPIGKVFEFGGIISNCSMRARLIGYEMVNSQRVVYNHLISNKREWNNCFIKFGTVVCLEIFRKNLIAFYYDKFNVNFF